MLGSIGFMSRRVATVGTFWRTIRVVSGHSAALMVAVALALVCAPAATADPAYLDPTGVYSGGPVPTANGVPCVSGHLGTCLSIRQNQRANGPAPRTGIGHSPTVRR